jgi:hypothetical protein
VTSIHHPAPINQFCRLEYDEVHKTYVKTTRWNDIVNGHNFDGENCMAAEGAVALDAHTQGKTRTSPAGIRNYQDDFSGGIGVDDVQTAWARHFGQTLLTPRDFDWNDVMYAIRAEHRHVALGADYRFVPDAYKRQLPGNFDHALGVDDYRSSDGAILIYDSLSTASHWQPQSSVKAAVEALALRVRGSRAQLFAGLTAKRPVLGTTALPKFRVVIFAYTPLYLSPNGAKAGGVTKATYICTRQSISGAWWYKILTNGSGGNTVLAGRYFKGVSSRMKVTYA